MVRAVGADATLLKLAAHSIVVAVVRLSAEEVIPAVAADAVVVPAIVAGYAGRATCSVASTYASEFSDQS